MHRVAFAGLAFMCATWIGCSGGEPCAVSGQVTFEGQPIADGNIKFDPAEDSTGASGAARIQNGRYEIPLDAGMFAGRFIVSVTANRKTGRTVKQFDSTTATMEEIVQYIPERYNLRSELQAELQGGENQKDFALGP